MKYVLMVYSRAAYAEYLLPQIEARNDARRTALEAIRPIRKLSDTIQHEEEVF